MNIVICDVSPKLASDLDEFLLQYCDHVRMEGGLTFIGEEEIDEEWHMDLY